MIVPQKLQNREFRFILIRSKTKEPCEAKWQEFNNYVFFHNKIKIATNVGIVCGKGNLIVLDIDKEELLEEFDKKCNTFSVKTGSGKRHYYFICREEFENSYYVLKDKSGELRIKNSQVLIPNSTHPNGNKYEVFNDVEIRIINKDKLRNIIGDLIIKDGKITDTTRSGREWGEVCSMIENGYNFDECDREMRLFNCAKWIEQTDEYRIRTYCKALESIKLKKNNIC
jgi:hypothetical protein